MKIAVAQIAVKKGDITTNLQTHLHCIHQASLHQIDFLVFPELSLTGYEPTLANGLAINQSELALDKNIVALQQQVNTHNIAVAVGFPTRKNDRLFISLVILRPSLEPIIYSKQHLYDVEQSIFSAGDKDLVLNFDEEKIALAICYDLSKENHASNAKKQNATVYIASVLNSFGGIESDLEKLASIAKSNQIVTLMANFIGESGGYDCAGQSSIWNNQGDLLIQLKAYQQGIVVIDTITEATEKIIF